ncbi:MAG TPA: POTRA domain-containing protein [Planctomycetaceae bacterium]|nr:POTRA domain-containing protein [Planctomycetaceae bacterium]
MTRPKSGERCLQSTGLRSVCALALALVSGVATAREPLAGVGFSTPKVAPQTAQKPVATATNLIIDVQFEGLDPATAAALAKQMRCRPGQAPSRQLLDDDIELLWASGRFGQVMPRWDKRPNGFVLTYVVSERAEPLVLRGQSEDEDPLIDAGHTRPAAPKEKTFQPLKKMSFESDSENTRAAVTELLQDPLAEVKIVGHVTIPQKDIEKHIKCRPERKATPEMIKEDVEALTRTRWFASVEHTLTRSDAGPVLTYKLLERPIVRNVEYRGCQKIKQAKLESLTNLKVGSSPYDVSANRECARRIEELYHEKGFAFATVELVRGDDKNDREVVFEINEGPKVYVSDVDFQGNEFFNDAILDLKLRTKKRLFWVFGGKYDPTTIPDDKASLQQYYHSLGFFDVDIQHEEKFNEDKSRVTIVYNITEGVRYKVRNIDVMGSAIIPEAELRKDHKVTGGEYFTQRKIAGDVEKMREQYGKLGRLFAKVDAQPRFTTEPGVVDILYKIDEDKVYRVREINVHVAGDYPHTRTNLVRNIATIQPGDLADPKKIQQTKTRIAGSGYFENDPQNAPRLDIRKVEEPWLKVPEADVNVARGQDSAVPMLAQGRGPTPPPQGYIFDSSPQGDPLRPGVNSPGEENLWEQMPPPEFIDIDAYLAEARTGRLMFGVGVNSNSGVVGNIVLQENNFDILRPPSSFEDLWNGTAWRGAGQKFRIEALPGTQVSRYLVDWQDPYFMDTNVNFGVSGFYFQRFYRFWSEQRVGGRVRAGYQLNQQWSTSVALRMEGVQISDIPAASPPLLLDAKGDSFLSTVRLGLAHDTRDSAFLPTTGHFVEGSIEQAFAEFDYTRLEVEGRQYFTTYQRPDGFGKHTLALFGNVAWTGDSTPIYERFYAGGFQSFRGFAFRGVTPLDGGVEVGGQFQTLGSVEYMLPVTANEMVKAVAFTDFGTVDRDVSLDKFRLSVGAGLRITVPGMGPVPIALDWAVPVMKQDFDRDQLFSFYIGINR